MLGKASRLVEGSHVPPINRKLSLLNTATPNGTPPQEYYAEVNAANYLSRVRVPLMIVNARDDPFVDGRCLPKQERVKDAPVRLIYHEYGGHCG